MGFNLKLWLAVIPPQKAISKKRKNQHKSNGSEEKRLKKTANDSDSENNEDPGENGEFQGPSLALLAESEKPENQNAILTVRQKKKLKHQERIQSQRSESSGKEMKRNEEYLQKWKHSRNEWKFEKLRQISIQQSVFDEKKLSASVWPLALEYLSGSKGAAKDKITKLAEDVIDKLDKQCTLAESEEARKAIVDSSEYQRARDLLQSFD